jgi:hypothetical protein
MWQTYQFIHIMYSKIYDEVIIRKAKTKQLLYKIK